MKKITFKRPHEEFNKNFAYNITIDGRNVAELQNGEEKTIEIPNDSKNLSLQAKLMWCGSKPISLANFPNEAVLTVRGNEFLNKKMPLMVAMIPLTSIPLFGMMEPPAKNIGLGVFIALLFGLLGTLTVWRNSWIYVEVEGN